MAELIDHIELDKSQEADIREGGVVWIHDNGTAQDIRLEALSASKLYDFLLLHMDRIQRHVQGQKVEHYNREMDECNRIAVENREKLWLPLVDGE